MAFLTREQIECCRRIGRDEEAGSTTIALVDFDALCDMALNSLSLKKQLEDTQYLAAKNQGDADAWRKAANLGAERMTDLYEQLETKRLENVTKKKKNHYCISPDVRRDPFGSPHCTCGLKWPCPKAKPE